MCLLRGTEGFYLHSAEFSNSSRVIWGYKKEFGGFVDSEWPVYMAGVGFLALFMPLTYIGAEKGRMSQGHESG